MNPIISLCNLLFLSAAFMTCAEIFYLTKHNLGIDSPSLITKVVSQMPATNFHSYKALRYWSNLNSFSLFALIGIRSFFYLYKWFSSNSSFRGLVDLNFKFTFGKFTYLNQFLVLLVECHYKFKVRVRMFYIK